MELEEFISHGHEQYLPNLSVDLVIIGFQEKELRCLLLRIGEKWLLPGGYIGRGESVDHAVQRVMGERTGLKDPHLSFLAVFGDRNRRFGHEWKAFLESSGLPWRDDSWLNGRFISLAYYALVNIAHTHPSVRAYDEAFGWFDFDDLPPLWMDHRSILEKARNQLKEDIGRELVSHHLLSEPFTMPELHRLHQTILGEKLDRSRFQKKMLSTGMFKRLPKKPTGSPGRNPYQYRVKRREA